MVTERQPTFGVLLKRFRTAAGRSQEELAERSGLSARAISDLERGMRRTPYSQTVEQLAHALGLSDADAATLEASVHRRRPRAPNRARGGAKSNLPLPSTRLIGRDSAVEALTVLLHHATIRLITLTGPGGVGKTRLALEVARATGERFPDGVHFVSLAGISDPALVNTSITLALGLREPPHRYAVFDAITAFLGRKKTLLVLDNFEHLLAAAPLIAQLLAACPNLHVLVTSRSPLNLTGEQAWPVAPLALPHNATDLSLHALADAPAVALFVERASRAAPDFSLTRANAQAIVEICRRIDGLPLAIELAASRVRTLSPQAMLARMTDRLGFLTGGPRDLPMRQQALRETIRWSYDLLSAEERRVLMHLAVFANGWTVDAAEFVCHGRSSVAMLDLLQVLLDQSLAIKTESGSGEPRFRMLETIREFALEQLAVAGEAETTHRNHAAYFRTLAEHADAELGGPEQRTWMLRLEDDHDNLRAVLRWTLERGEFATGLQIAGSVWRFWHQHGHLTEGRQWLDRLLAMSLGSATVPQALRAKALIGAGNLALYQADYPAASSHHKEGITLYAAIGDWLGIARTRGSLGLVAYHQGQFAVAAKCYAESLRVFRQCNNPAGIANTLNNYAVMVRAQGEYARARRLHEEALAIQREIGDLRGIAQGLANLGIVAHHENDLARAAALLEESLALRRQLNAPRGIADSLAALGWVILHHGDRARATELFKQGLVLQRDLQDPAGIAACLEGIAAVADSYGQPVPAVRLLYAAATVRAVIDEPVAVSNHGVFVNRLLDAVRVSLDPTDYAQASAAGSALSLGDAITLALRFTPSQPDTTGAQLRMLGGVRR